VSRPDGSRKKKTAHNKKMAGTRKKPARKAPARAQKAARHVAAKRIIPQKTEVVSGPAVPPAHVLTHEAVRHRAYLKWLDAGQPHGDGANFWLEAEEELRNGCERSLETA
jgi:hypothetical protein